MIWSVSDPRWNKLSTAHPTEELVPPERRLSLLVELSDLAIGFIADPELRRRALERTDPRSPEALRHWEQLVRREDRRPLG